MIKHKSSESKHPIVWLATKWGALIAKRISTQQVGDSAEDDMYIYLSYIYSIPICQEGIAL